MHLHDVDRETFTFIWRINGASLQYCSFCVQKSVELMKTGWQPKLQIWKMTASSFMHSLSSLSYWYLRIYGRRTIRDCVSTSFIISHHVWQTCTASAIVVAVTVVVIGCTIISLLQWLTHFLLFHETILVVTIPLTFCCRFLPQISYYPKFI